MTSCELGWKIQTALGSCQSTGAELGWMLCTPCSGLVFPSQAKACTFPVAESGLEGAVPSCSQPGWAVQLGGFVV